MITYRSVELGADSALVGAVGATFALAPLLFAIPIGRWVDRGRAGFALFAGAGISLLTAFSLLFINSIPLLMLAMPMLGIGHLLQRMPENLSGGERQRVAIARALLTSPRLLLMDEPLASLDRARREEILPVIERLRDELRVPILYVSHDRDEVARLATTVVPIE